MSFSLSRDFKKLILIHWLIVAYLDQDYFLPTKTPFKYSDPCKNFKFIIFIYFLLKENNPLQCITSSILNCKMILSIHCCHLQQIFIVFAKEVSHSLFLWSFPKRFKEAYLVMGNLTVLAGHLVNTNPFICKEKPIIYNFSFEKRACIWNFKNKPYSGATKCPDNLGTPYCN